MPSQGPNGADVFTSVDPLAGAEPDTFRVPWTNPANAASSDNAYATSQVEWYSSFPAGTNTGTYQLRAQDFDFSIPAEATIVGLEVFIEAKAGTASRVGRPAVLLINGSAGDASDDLGTQSGVASAIATTDTTYTVGSHSDLMSFGSPALTPAIVNGADFGVAVWCRSNIATTHTTSVSVDAVTVTIHYTVGTASSLSCDGVALAAAGGVMTPARSGATSLSGGTFTLSGGAMAPAGSLPAGGGTFACVGGALGFVVAGRVASSGGAFAIPGGAACLPLKVALGAETFAIAGGVMTPRRAQTLVLADGSFSAVAGTLALPLRSALGGGAFAAAGGTMIAFWWNPVTPTSSDWAAVGATAPGWTDV